MIVHMVIISIVDIQAIIFVIANLVPISIIDIIATHPHDRRHCHYIYH